MLKHSKYRIFVIKLGAINYACIINFYYIYIVKNFISKDLPTIDYMLRTTWNAVAKAYNGEATKYNFTMVMGFALLSIDPKVGTASTSLGPKMGMEPTSLSRTLKNLEERELIERHPNPDDGRGVIIKLTAEGKESREIAKQVVLQFNQKIEEEFGLEKLRIFFEVTQGIQNMISERKIFNNE